MDIEISDNKSRLNLELIHDYISNRSYWGKGRTLEQVQCSIANSTCFGVYKDNSLIAFCRVLSDEVAFAYLMDFFVLENFQGQGVGKALAAHVLSRPEFLSVNWLLATHSAHAFYQQFGFIELERPDRLMRKPARQDSN